MLIVENLTCVVLVGLTTVCSSIVLYQDLHPVGDDINCASLLVSFTISSLLQYLSKLASCWRIL
jgi:hypothetical protein